MSTGSSVRDDFTLTLGGTEYRFHWGMGEVIEMQERLTTPHEVPSVYDMDLGVRRGRLKYLRALIYSGLRQHHPLVTEKKVEALMQEASAEEMSALLVAFGYATTPDPKDVKILQQQVKKGNPRKAQTKRKTVGADSTSAPVASV